MGRRPTGESFAPKSHCRGVVVESLLLIVHCSQIYDSGCHIGYTQVSAITSQINETGTRPGSRTGTPETPSSHEPESTLPCLPGTGSPRVGGVGAQRRGREWAGG